MGEKIGNIKAMRIGNRSWKKLGMEFAKMLCVGCLKYRYSRVSRWGYNACTKKMPKQGYSPYLHWVSRDISYAAKAHFLYHPSKAGQKRWAILCYDGKYLAKAGMVQKAKNIKVMRVRNRAWEKSGCSLWIN